MKLFSWIEEIHMNKRIYWFAALTGLVVCLHAEDSWSGSAKNQALECQNWGQAAQTAFGFRQAGVPKVHVEIVLAGILTMPAQSQAVLDRILKEAYTWPRGAEDLRLHVVELCLKGWPVSAIEGFIFAQDALNYQQNYKACQEELIDHRIIVDAILQGAPQEYLTYRASNYLSGDRQARVLALIPEAYKFAGTGADPRDFFREAFAGCMKKREGTEHES
jgi:hypothetical protein